MKKTISISVDEKLLKEFDGFADELWTNRTNLINMMMTEALRRWEVNFKAEEEIINDKLKFQNNWKQLLA